MKRTHPIIICKKKDSEMHIEDNDAKRAAINILESVQFFKAQYQLHFKKTYRILRNNMYLRFTKRKL